MKRKLAWLAALLLTLAVVAWFEPTCVVRGWLRGAAFYQGRPTAYWSRELGHWNGPSALLSWIPSSRTVFRDGVAVTVDHNAPAVADWNGVVGAAPFFVNIAEADALTIPALARGDVNNAIWVDLSFYSRRPTFIDKLAGYVGVTLEYPDRPAILTGDPAAEPVLRELLDDPSEEIRAHARAGLRQLHAAANPLLP